MKKSGVKSKSVSKQNSSNKKLVIGIIIGLILGLFIGGTINLTGNVVGDICNDDSDCDAGEYCSAGMCMGTDNDYDGYDTTTDCNDNDANIYPGNWEQCGDSIDNDCDSTTPDTCDPGFTCSAGTCMDDTTSGSTPPVQTTGECTLNSDCDALYPGMGYICETEYCMPNTEGGSTPPVQTTGECTLNSDCDALYPGMGYICETEYCMPNTEGGSTPPV